MQSLMNFAHECWDSIFGNRPLIKIAYICFYLLTQYVIMIHTYDYYLFPIGILFPFLGFFWVFRD